MDFTYENQGHVTYLIYAVKAGDELDTMALGMITHNKIPGLAAGVFTQIDTVKYIKFNVSSKISMQQLFSGTVSKKILLAVFKGIISSIISAEDYMIGADSLVFDLDYVFVDVSTCAVSMICLPIVRSSESSVNLLTFIKNIMFSTHFDQNENCDYVAKIINYLNTAKEFSAEDFSHLIDSLQNAPASAPAQQPVPQQVVEKKAFEPVPESPAPQQQYGFEPQTEHSSHGNVSSFSVRQDNTAVQQTYQVPNVNRTPMNPAPAAQRTINQSIPPQAKQAVRPAPEVATENGKKKGLFGLFSGKEKKSKEKNPEQANIAPSKSQLKRGQNNGRNSDGFAVPGQNKPINNGSFAVPGQNKPINNGNFAVPGQNKPINNNGNFAVPGQNKPINNGSFAVPGQNKPINNGSFAVPGQNKPINNGSFAVPGQNNPINKNGGFSESSQFVPEEPSKKFVDQRPFRSKKNSAKSAPQPQPAQQPVLQPVSPSMPMNFGETTVLGGGEGGEGETTVLGDLPGTSAQQAVKRPFIVRVKNNERIAVDKPVFRIGKERSFVDYFVGDNAYVSRVHANVVQKDGRYYIIDNNSRNRTFVNGEAITSSTEVELHSGDTFKLANEEFEFKLF